MEPWTYIAERWPEHVLGIRRRCAGDPALRSLVDDYVEARSALDRWRGIDPAGSPRIADYEGLVGELEAEIDRSIAPG